MADPALAWTGSVAYFELGGASGAPPLLVSHATGFHGHCYRAVAAALGERFHTWALDHRGHGFSPLPAGWEVDWRDYGTDALDVARVLAERSGEPVVGFGHSMGGATLLMAAHSDPAVFERLVLFEPIAFPPAEYTHAGGMPLAEGARRRRAWFESYDAAYANYASKPPLMWLEPDVLRDYVDYGFRPADDDVDGPGGGVVLRCAPGHEAATFATGGSSGVWDLLPHIGVPVTVIGSGDGDGPALVAPRIAELIPGAEFALLHDQTHFGPLSHPAVTAELITG